MNEVPKEALIKIEINVLRALNELKKSKEKNELQQRLLEKNEQERHDLKHQVEETQQNLMSQLRKKDAEVSPLKYELDRLKNKVAKLKQTNKTCASLKGQLQETKAQLLEQNEIRK